MRTFNAPGLKCSKAKGLLDCHNCSIDYTRIRGLKQVQALRACPSGQGMSLQSQTTRNGNDVTTKQEPRLRSGQFLTDRNIVGETKSRVNIPKYIYVLSPAPDWWLPATENRPAPLAGNAGCAQATRPDARSTLGYLFTFKRVLTNLITHFWRMQQRFGADCQEFTNNDPNGG